MLEKSKVSIIVPVYNAEKYIDKCVESLINQTYKNIEILLIDDGSNDNTKDKCLSFKDKRVMYFYKKNGGPSSARNIGIEKSTGKYIVFVDADDYISYDAIQKMVKCFKKNCLVRINYDYVFNGNEFKNKTKYIGEYTGLEYLNGIINNIFPGFVCTTLFEKSKIGTLRFDENISFMEDMLFLVRYILKIDYVKYSAGTYYYVQSNSSITCNNKNVLDNLVNMNYSLNKIQEYLKGFISQDKINFKKVYLFEKEIAKIQKYKDLKILLNSPEFINIINTIKLDNAQPFIYKFILFLYKNKMSFLLIIIIKFRVLLKGIRNKVKY